MCPTVKSAFFEAFASFLGVEEVVVQLDRIGGLFFCNPCEMYGISDVLSAVSD
jgi:hypothetical protein